MTLRYLLFVRFAGNPLDVVLYLRRVPKRRRTPELRDNRGSFFYERENRFDYKQRNKMLTCPGVMPRRAISGTSQPLSSEVSRKVMTRQILDDHSYFSAPKMERRWPLQDPLSASRRRFYL